MNSTFAQIWGKFEKEWNVRRFEIFWKFERKKIKIQPCAQFTDRLKLARCYRPLSRAVLGIAVLFWFFFSSKFSKIYFTLISESEYTGGVNERKLWLGFFWSCLGFLKRQFLNLQLRSNFSAKAKESDCWIWCQL